MAHVCSGVHKEGFVSFLYFKLLQYESISPIKEGRLVFSRLLHDLTISAPTSTPQAFLFSCSTVSLYKASHKVGLGKLLAKNAPVLLDTPEVPPNEARGILRRLTRPWELWRLTQGSRTDVPWMPAVLLYDPIPLGGCQHHSGHSFWLEIRPYCERPHWYERNIFIKRSVRNLLGKLWTCWICILQVILPQIFFFFYFSIDKIQKIINYLLFLPQTRDITDDSSSTPLPSYEIQKVLSRSFQHS